MWSTEVALLGGPACVTKITNLPLSFCWILWVVGTSQTEGDCQRDIVLSDERRYRDYWTASGFNFTEGNTRTQGDVESSITQRFHRCIPHWNVLVTTGIHRQVLIDWQLCVSVKRWPPIGVLSYYVHYSYAMSTQYPSFYRWYAPMEAPKYYLCLSNDIGHSKIILIKWNAHMISQSLDLSRFSRHK